MFYQTPFFEDLDIINIPLKQIHKKACPTIRGYKSLADQQQAQDHEELSKQHIKQ